MGKHARRWFAFIVVMGVVAIVACGGASETSVDRATLASGCVLDSDCVEPLRCAFKVCHNACAASRDCPNGQRCVAADRPFNVCQLPAEATCNFNSSCPKGQRCASDRQCRDECAGDVDCVGGQVCVTGACAESKELVNGKLPDPVDGGVLPNVGQACVRPSDCVSPLTCLGGQCTYECQEQRDCATGRQCVERACILIPQDAGGGSMGVQCVRNSDCASPLVCLANTCTYQCLEDRDCSSGLHCSGHLCTAVSGGGDASCTPVDCATAGKDCGTILDGCGGTKQCSATTGAMDCALGQVCGGGGPNKCGTSMCVPKTCSQLGLDCGLVSDGCSGVLYCGLCPSGKTCGGAGTANKCGCIANNTAACAGKACGSAVNNCQDTVSCGTCPMGQTCGGGGTANQCGCPAKTCADLGLGCGTAPDGCGGTAMCPACTVAGQTCGGGGTPNQCGTGACTPRTCAQLGKNCGTVSNGCNATLDCGATCPAGQTCGGAGVANVCGCVAKTCDQLNANCGPIDNGCGVQIPSCGTCVAPTTCGGAGTANRCGCTPTTCAAQGKDCGTIQDGCGGTLSCGSCVGGKVCGASGTANVCSTPGPTPSCNGVAATCGPTSNDDCCRSETVVGTDGVVPWSRRWRTAAPPTAQYPVQVANFKLDAYEVTIGRFRAFARAANTYAFQSSHPPAGAGANSNIAATVDIYNPTVPGPAPTWQATWNASLPTDYTNLTNRLQSCGDGMWTANPAGFENHAVRCVNWYEAFAFCAWDGGRLVTQSEFSYAYHGGFDYRDMPWGNDYTNPCNRDSFNTCTWPNRVGAQAAGIGKWGQYNLAGGLIEWMFDQGPFPQTPDCSARNCAYTRNDNYRGLNGISYNYGFPLSCSVYQCGTPTTIYQDQYFDLLQGGYGTDASQRQSDIGFRCARNL